MIITCFKHIFKFNNKIRPIEYTAIDRINYAIIRKLKNCVKLSEEDIVYLKTLPTLDILDLVNHYNCNIKGNEYIIL